MIDVFILVMYYDPISTDIQSKYHTEHCLICSPRLVYIITKLHRLTMRPTNLRFHHGGGEDSHDGTRRCRDKLDNSSRRSGPKWRRPGMEAMLETEVMPLSR